MGSSCMFVSSYHLFYLKCRVSKNVGCWQKLLEGVEQPLFRLSSLPGKRSKGRVM